MGFLLSFCSIIGTVLKTDMNRLERNYLLLLKLKYSIFSHFYLEHGWITAKQI